MDRRTFVLSGSTAAAALAAGPAAADRLDKARDTVEDSAATLRDFADDDRFRGLARTAGRAKALVVLPTSVRAGFLIGASGGNGVMIARKGSDWSPPTFLRVSSVSFGFQAGGEIAQIVLAVMTERGVDQMLSTSVKLGADLSIAAGPVGGGAKAQTADILAYSKSQGLYGSVSVEGAVLKTHNNWNEAYYRREVAPRDIILFGRVSNPQAAPLRAAARALVASRG